ncbi:MAG: KpsF/GutQ family sugar-phosphate isomerase [Planctomycetota bacterium]
MGRSNHADDPRLARAAEVIQLEARTIANLEALLDERFSEAVDRIVACSGMLVVTGMGKAGLIGAKVSATLASTGTPSLSLHPAEALHGDLGRIRDSDVVLALSNSGETVEVNALVPRAHAIGAGVIAMTGAPESTLGRLADCVLDIGRVDEACPLGLAPTASTSAMLALGDALAMVVLAERGFSREDYARYHPSGSLGRRLMRVREVMRQGDELPLCPTGAAITEVILTMSRTKGRPGAALIVGEDGRLAGLFTDGDLRRLLEGGSHAQLDHPVNEFMTAAPKVARPDQLLEEAEGLLREYRLDQVPVVDDGGRPVGLLDVQDVLTTKV